MSPGEHMVAEDVVVSKTVACKDVVLKLFLIFNPAQFTSRNPTSGRQETMLNPTLDDLVWSS